MLPVFENLGITVLSEQPFNLRDTSLHIADFAVQLPRADALEDETTRAASVDLEKLLRDEAEKRRLQPSGIARRTTGSRITILRVRPISAVKPDRSFSQVLR